VQAPSSPSAYVASLPISPLPISLQVPASASLIHDFPQLDLLPIIPLELLRVVLRITADYVLSLTHREGELIAGTSSRLDIMSVQE